MVGSAIVAVVVLVAQYAASSVSICGCHQPEEPAVLKEKKN